MIRTPPFSRLSRSGDLQFQLMRSPQTILAATQLNLSSLSSAEWTFQGAVCPLAASCALLAELCLPSHRQPATGLWTAQASTTLGTDSKHQSFNCPLSLLHMKTYRRQLHSRWFSVAGMTYQNLLWLHHCHLCDVQVGALRTRRSRMS